MFLGDSFRRWLPAAACLTILCFHGVARADDKLICATIDNDAERLACYDLASGRSFSAQTPLTAVSAASPSLLEEAWGFDPSSRRYLLRYHRMNYILPITYTSDRNIEPWEPFRQLDIQDGEVNLDDEEAKFQISFRYRLWTTDDRKLGFWFGYTQLSTWQVYNEAESRPFRDTNYQPELFLSYNPGVDIGSFRWSLLNVGYNHESNGRAYVITRSWDRLFAEAGFENGNFALIAKAWYRFSEGDDDDNPGITDYYGYGQLTAFYRWRDSSFSLMGRGNWNSNKGAVEASYVSRPLIGPLRGYLQVFSGYGETMIDYDWKQTVVGAGIAINSIL
jgi:phospholipase A1